MNIFIYFSPMILVTGGTGLVGAHLLYRLLQKEDTVRAIYRNKDNLKYTQRVFSYYTKDSGELFKKIIWVEANICDLPSLETAFKGITHVYHCAALISFDKRDYHKMRKINIEGTANMVNLAIDHNITKFCYVSSIATIEKNVNDQLITETNDWNTQTNNYGYAITKYGAEIEVWRGSQEGLDVVMVNPGVILGSGFWHNGPGELFTKVYNKFKFYSEGITGFVGVKDVVKVMIQLMESDIKNERFILVSKNTSFKNIFFQIADELKVKRPHIKVTKLLSEMAWRLAWVKSIFTGTPPLITKHSAKASRSKYKYSSEKIKKALGFEFEDLKVMIKDSCKDFKKDHQN